VRAFTTARAREYPSLDAVKARAKAEIPPTCRARRAAFANDIDRATGSSWMEHFLRPGRKNDRVFPAKLTPPSCSPPPIED
jgi:hypothetical protein